MAHNVRPENSEASASLWFSHWIDDEFIRKAVSENGSAYDLACAFHWASCTVSAVKPDNVSDNNWSKGLVEAYRNDDPAFYPKPNTRLPWRAVYYSLLLEAGGDVGWSVGINESFERTVRLPDNIKNIIRDMYVEWLLVK